MNAVDGPQPVRCPVCGELGQHVLGCPERPRFEFPCTECGGNAFLGYRNWKVPGGVQVVGEDERLCNACFRERTESPTEEDAP